MDSWMDLLCDQMKECADDPEVADIARANPMAKRGAAFFKAIKKVKRKRREEREEENASALSMYHQSQCHRPRVS